eukprot:m.353068 g.353068  ORF g.353068 m.353068 type:complete len:378 (+) comp16677_c0_seq1:183-1316(+)
MAVSPHKSRSLPTLELTPEFIPVSGVVLHPRWLAVRSTDMPEMISYEFYFTDSSGVDRMAYFRRNVQTSHTCQATTMSSSDMLEPTSPLHRFIYRDMMDTGWGTLEAQWNYNLKQSMEAYLECRPVTRRELETRIRSEIQCSLSAKLENSQCWDGWTAAFSSSAESSFSTSLNTSFSSQATGSEWPSWDDGTHFEACDIDTQSRRMRLVSLFREAELQNLELIEEPAEKITRQPGTRSTPPSPLSKASATRGHGAFVEDGQFKVRSATSASTFVNQAAALMAWDGSTTTCLMQWEQSDANKQAQLREEEEDARLQGSLPIVSGWWTSSPVVSNVNWDGGQVVKGFDIGGASVVEDIEFDEGFDLPRVVEYYWDDRLQ